MSFKSKDLSNKIIVVKIGGSTLGEGDSTVPDIISIKKSNFKPVVVHGGGKTITEWAAKQGLLPEFVNGLRRTNKETLDIAIAVLTGLVNSQIVAEFQVLGGNALGVSGLDGGILKAEMVIKLPLYGKEIILRRIRNTHTKNCFRKFQNFQMH